MNYKLPYNLLTDYPTFVNFAKNNRLPLNLRNLYFIHKSTENVLNRIKWCNIEQAILDSFKKGDWNNIISKDELENNAEALLYCRIVAWVREENHINIHMDNDQVIQKYYDAKKFSIYLYSELLEFEKIFRNFIISAIKNSRISNKKVKEQFLTKIINVDSHIRIDTFNYTDSFISLDDYEIKHINGDLKNGFFGIDRIDEVNECEEVMKYYKSTRRLYNNSKETSIYKDLRCENAVIIGHSLNKQDYGYFYCLFDDMKLSDSNSSNKIVFVCNIYKRDEEDNIRNQLVKTVRDLINSYSIEHLELKDTHLFDILTINGRLIIVDFDSEGLAEKVIK